MNDYLKSMREYAAKNGIPILLPETESLVRLLVQLKRPEKILEIGTAIGYSAAVMLAESGDSTELYTVEIDEERYNAAKTNLREMGLLSRANLFLGDAGEILQVMTGQYDLVFLDGPKGQYVKFLPHILNLMPQGGLLICDNVLYHGLVDGTVKMRRKSLTMITNLRDFLQEIKDSDRLTTSILQAGDGIALCLKK